MPGGVATGLLTARPVSRHMNTVVVPISPVLAVVEQGGHPVPPDTRSLVAAPIAIVISRHIGGGH